MEQSQYGEVIRALKHAALRGNSVTGLCLGECITGSESERVPPGMRQQRMRCECKQSQPYWLCRAITLAAHTSFATPLLTTPLSMMSSQATSSSSSPSTASSSGGAYAQFAPSSRDLSYVLAGQSPAQLLADIEATELNLRRMHRVLVQEQTRVKQEEALIRDKLQQSAPHSPTTR